MLFPTHVPAVLIGKKGFKPQTASDTVYLNGAAVDRRGARSGLAIVLGVFATTGGQAGEKQTLTVLVEHHGDTGFSGAAALKTYTRDLVWAANGTTEIYAYVPLDLSLAKQYIRVRAKLTKTGSQSIADQQLATALILCGLEDAPAVGYSNDGYAATVEPAPG